MLLKKMICSKKEGRYQELLQREEFLDKVTNLILKDKLDFLRHIKSKQNNYDTLSTD